MTEIVQVLTLRILNRWCCEDLLGFGSNSAVSTAQIPYKIDRE